MAAHPKNKTLIVDEVQRVPALLDVVHEQIETKRDIRSVLTGSSSRKLKREGVNLLGGRAQKRTLHPFIAAELGDSFLVEDASQYGLLPIVCGSPDPLGTLNAYIALYIKEEVQAEGLVRKIDRFARFIEAVSFSHGALLNVTDVSRECQVSRKTVESFIEIIEDLLLAFRIPVFSRRAQRQMASHPKFFWYDCGVFRALRPKGPLDRASEIGGAALEGLVAQHLRAWVDYSARGVELSFWRTKAGNEVDFVLYGEKCFHAIEVKSSRDLRGLKAFKEDFPDAELRLLYAGTERLQVGGVLCMPVREFLLGVEPNSSLP